MTNLSLAFIELVRRAKLGKRSSFYRQCESCNQRTMYVLTVATDLHEQYACANCGMLKTWQVR